MAINGFNCSIIPGRGRTDIGFHGESFFQFLPPPLDLVSEGQYSNKTSHTRGQSAGGSFHFAPLSPSPFPCHTYYTTHNFISHPPILPSSPKS